MSYESLRKSARQDAAADHITHHMWPADILKPHQSNQVLKTDGFSTVTESLICPLKIPETNIKGYW